MTSLYINVAYISLKDHITPGKRKTLGYYNTISPRVRTQRQGSRNALG